MTHERAEKELGKLRATIDLIERLIGADLIEHVANVDGQDTYTQGPASVETRRAMFIKEFGPDKMEYYYMSSGDLLVHYHHPRDNVHVIHRDTDATVRLAKVSNGKCHVEDVTTTMQQVVCGAEV